MNFDLKKLVKNNFSRQELINLTKNLIKIPSHCNTPEREKKIADYMYNWLKNKGIEVELIPVIEGRNNVIAKVKGNRKGKKLMLNGHIDTVPPYEMKNPYNPYIKNGKIFGRGSCDMKGAIASMMMALVSIKRAKIDFSGEIIFTGVINEEMKSEGTENIIKRGIKADGAVVGEPTNLSIAIGHRGLEWIRIIIEGKAAHGGSPEKGINAISKAADFIKEVENNLYPKLKRRVHPVVGEPVLNFGVIKGGDQPSTVAGKCIIEIDRRWTPNETLKQVFEDINNIISQIEKRDIEFKAKLERISKNMATMDHRPVLIEKENPLVQNLKDISTEILEKKVEISSLGGWTDASLLSNYGNIPTLNFGPGKMSVAHSVNENVEIKQLISATVIYGVLGINF